MITRHSLVRGITLTVLTGTGLAAATSTVMAGFGRVRALRMLRARRQVRLMIAWVLQVITLFIRMALAITLRITRRSIRTAAMIRVRVISLGRILLRGITRIRAMGIFGVSSLVVMS